MSIAKVIKIYPASELARRLSQLRDPITGRKQRVSPQAVAKWVRADRIPAARCLAIEQLVGGRVTRYEMRPDVFGKQAAA